MSSEASGESFLSGCFSLSGRCLFQDNGIFSFEPERSPLAGQRTGVREGLLRIGSIFRFGGFNIFFAA